MQSIDPKSLSILQTRIAYLKSFIDFTQTDAAALHAAKPVVEALIPGIIDAVYKKLLSYDITAKAFVPRQTGYDGVAPTKLEELDLEHPMIKYRMGFLKGYLKKLVVADYDDLGTWVWASLFKSKGSWANLICRSTLIKSGSCTLVLRALPIVSLFRTLTPLHFGLTGNAQSKETRASRRVHTYGTSSRLRRRPGDCGGPGSSRPG